MKIFLIGLIITSILFLIYSCKDVSNNKENYNNQTKKEVTAKEILGDPDYLAISYGGYRENSRKIQPTVAQIKEDMKILAAMNIKILRTYNTHFAHAGNVLRAIQELKAEDSSFEMYVMLGVWIDCQGAFTASPNHENEDEAANASEINRAVQMANEYPDIVKIIAVGNEAMVKWATSYYVQPWVILKWVNYLQNLKESDQLAKDLWITCSDNFASWGGGDSIYHTEDLTELMKAVDYISLHTYPMHDTHYNPSFWGVLKNEQSLSKIEKIHRVMDRAVEYTKLQYNSTKNYIRSQGVNVPIHIGETGWASASNELYGDEGSKATDEYKEGLYYQKTRKWTDQEGIACFYFEAFDENWKDAGNPGGSENYFGLFTIDGKAKYAIWDLVDKGIFDGLTRGGQTIIKTKEGNTEQLLISVNLPPQKRELSLIHN
jgi:exo-beta-1,3-glucanase (GH17 family)